MCSVFLSRTGEFVNRDAGFRDQGSGFRVQGLGFMDQGLFMIEGLGIRVVWFEGLGSAFY